LGAVIFISLPPILAARSLSADLGDLHQLVQIIDGDI
jgi:hypothetical protein